MACGALASSQLPPAAPGELAPRLPPTASPCMGDGVRAGLPRPETLGSRGHSQSHILSPWVSTHPASVCVVRVAHVFAPLFENPQT